MFSLPVATSRMIQWTSLAVETQFMSGIPSFHSTGEKYIVSTIMNDTMELGSPWMLTVNASS